MLLTPSELSWTAGLCNIRHQQRATVLLAAAVSSTASWHVRYPAIRVGCFFAICKKLYFVLFRFQRGSAQCSCLVLFLKYTTHGWGRVRGTLQTFSPHTLLSNRQKTDVTTSVYEFIASRFRALCCLCVNTGLLVHLTLAEELSPYSWKRYWLTSRSTSLSR
jgi:hypothetical protein